MPSDDRVLSQLSTLEALPAERVANVKRRSRMVSKSDAAVEFSDDEDDGLGAENEVVAVGESDIEEKLAWWFL